MNPTHKCLSETAPPLEGFMVRNLQQKQCPLSKGTKMVPFFQQGPIFHLFFATNTERCPIFPRGHHFQPFCGKWCPTGTVLENGALLVGALCPKKSTIFSKGPQRALFWLRIFCQCVLFINYFSCQLLNVF